MKKLVLSLITMLTVLSGMAQAPNMFKYQAVARNTAGDLIANQTVSFEISILQNSSGGSPVYTETHVATTNQHGLVNLNVGGGAVTFGTFSTIDWGAAIYFIQVKMDPLGGSAYVLMGSSQLLSVPYALNAKTVSSIDWSDVTNVPADLADGDDNSGSADWSTLTGKPAGFSDNVDNDVIAGLTCSINQIALYNGSSWVCTTYYPTTGQTSASVFGTAQAVAFFTTTTYTLIPGLTQTITVPANARVIISTDGGVQCAAAGIVFAAVDIGIHVDGVASPQGGQQQIIASNTDAVGQMITYWNMTKTYNLAAGTHTIDVRYRDSGNGTADGNVSEQIH
jgi:hypothetical protein